MSYSITTFRRRALEALKGHWQTALLIALIVNLPMLLVQSITTYTGNNLPDRLQAVLITASRDGVFTQDLLVTELRSFLQSSGFWTMQGLYLLAFLITPCLTLGLYAWVMNRLRGKEEPVFAVFSRLRMFFKALRLHLWILLKILLWMLPGVGLMLLILVPMLLTGRGSAPVDTASVARIETDALLLFIEVLALNVIAAMGIPAALAAMRYSLSEYILTEEPGEKVTACVKRSKALMRRRIRPMLLLMLRFLPLYAIQLFISAFLTGVSPVVADIFQMLSGLALSLYVTAAVAALYLAYTATPPPGPAEPESTVPDPPDAA